MCHRPFKFKQSKQIQTNLESIQKDIVERFHLLVVLAFVAAEDAANGGGWLPAPPTLFECARIFGWEVAIDITKHAVLGKFNDIRPGVYREYARDLCLDALGAQSHGAHKLVRCGGARALGTARGGPRGLGGRGGGCGGRHGRMGRRTTF